MKNNKSFDSSLQDVVYSLDVGIGLKILRGLLYFLLVLITLLIYQATQFHGLTSAEAMDLAQLGRNFSFQDGLVTKNISPMTIYEVEKFNQTPEINNHPNLIHPPGYPILLSFGYKFFQTLGLDPFSLGGSIKMPAEQWVIIPLNHLFTLLTGCLIFSIGKHLFYREIGFLSMTIYFLSDIAWQTSISGLNLSMAIFFSTAAYRSIIISIRYNLEENNKTRFFLHFIYSIIFSAIAFYSRFLSAFIVIGILIYLWLCLGKFRGGTSYFFIYLILFLLLITPWLLRNYFISGNPFGFIFYTALQDTVLYPDVTFLREYANEISFKEISNELKQKWILNYSGAYQSLIPGVGGGLLISFFITTFFYKFIRPNINYLRTSLGICAIAFIFVAGFFSDSSINLINMFWPFVIIFGLSFFYILLDRLNFSARLYVVIAKCFIVGLTIIPFGLRLMPPHEGRPYPPYYPPYISMVSSEWMNDREVICTDMPWATAWYGNRISILLPKDLEQYYLINDYKQYISAIYFTTLTKNKPFLELVNGYDKDWMDIMNGRLPTDFPLKSLINLNKIDQTFLSDSERWNNSSSE